MNKDNKVCLKYMDNLVEQNVDRETCTRNIYFHVVKPFYLLLKHTMIKEKEKENNDNNDKNVCFYRRSL